MPPRHGGVAVLAPRLISPSSAASSLGGCTGHLDASSSPVVTQNPPEKAPREQWSDDHAAVATTMLEKTEESALIPPEHACFQVWGGKGNKWITYDEPTQEILREAYKRHGCAEFSSADGKRSYEVSLRPNGMWQVRNDLPDWATPTLRNIRVVDREDDEIAV